MPIPLLTLGEVNASKYSVVPNRALLTNFALVRLDIKGRTFRSWWLVADLTHEQV